MFGAKKLVDFQSKHSDDLLILATTIEADTTTSRGFNMSCDDCDHFRRAGYPDETPLDESYRRPLIPPPRFDSLRFDDTGFDADHEGSGPQACSTGCDPRLRENPREIHEPETPPPYWHYISQVEFRSLRTSAARPSCRALIRGFLLGVLVMIIINLLVGTQIPDTRYRPASDIPVKNATKEEAETF